jgi:tetratricopeptide (TPR) repeat protein
LTDHPSADELLALVRGRLAPQRGSKILRHLYGGCEICLAAAPAGLAVGLGAPRGLTAKEEAATEAAIDRAFVVALNEDRKLRRRQDQRKRAVKILLKDGVKGPEKLSRSMKQVDKIEALLEASWSLRHEDIRMMIFFARLAVECAEQLDARKYGSKEVFDLQCRAQAELGNAYRASDQLANADVALEHARRLFELGSRDEGLENHLLNLEASLDGDCRRFGAACLKLDKIAQNYRRKGDNHLLGRALIRRAVYVANSGNPDEALRLLQESLSLIDMDRDPSVAYAAMHNQITCLVECRRFDEAERRLFLLRPLQPHSGGRINQLRFRWEEGRIDAGLERTERAEGILREVAESFSEINRAYDSALASLDLSAVLLEQRKAREATKVVTAAYTIFSGLRIEREGLMAVLMLRTACEMRVATRRLAEKIASYLRRLENDPHAELED